MQPRIVCAFGFGQNRHDVLLGLGGEYELSFYSIVGFGTYFGFAGGFRAISLASAGGDGCGQNGSFAGNYDSASSSVGHLMVCDGTNWRTFLTFNTAGDLSAQGGIKVGTAIAAVCNPANEGTMRYSSENQCTELCVSNEWACMGQASCDATPDVYNFPNKTGLILTTVSSSILQIDGMSSDCMANISISGDGNPSYRICSDASCSSVLVNWTNASLGYEMQDRYIQIRASASAVLGVTHNVSLQIGNRSDAWRVTAGL
jgi:hypothetical protein